MKFYYAVVSSSLMLGAASRDLKTPWVRSTVEQVIKRPAHYHVYRNETAASPACTGTPSNSPQQSTPTPYWYEEIAHQGISAFGPSGYAVYRNVKDYGATGIRTQPYL